MDTRALAILIAVAEEGSFAAAARRSRIDPSQVSRAIASLEQSVGVRLFNRTTRSMILTQSGERLVKEAAPLMRRLYQLLDELGDANRSVEGEVRLTASVAFGTEVLAPLIPEFLQQHPGIELNLVLEDRPLDLIRERLDIAIRLGERPEADYIGLKLIDSRHRVLATPGYIDQAGAPDTPADLARHRVITYPMIGYDTKWIFRKVGDRSAGSDTVAITSCCTISNALALKAAVINGAGPGMIAEWLIGEAVASGQLVDLFPKHDVTATSFETAAWMIYPKKEYLPRKTRTVLDFLKNRFSRQNRRYQT